MGSTQKFPVLSDTKGPPVTISKLIGKYHGKNKGPAKTVYKKRKKDSPKQKEVIDVENELDEPAEISSEFRDGTEVDCNYCGETDLANVDLLEHIRAYHKGIKNSVPPRSLGMFLCPHPCCQVCLHDTRSLVAHITYFHSNFEFKLHKKNFKCHQYFEDWLKEFDRDHSTKMKLVDGTNSFHCELSSLFNPRRTASMYKCRPMVECPAYFELFEDAMSDGCTIIGCFAHMGHNKKPIMVIPNNVPKAPVQSRKLFTCKLCGENYSNSNALRYHRNSHHAGRSIRTKCALPACGRFFDTMKSYLEHVSMDHMRSEIGERVIIFQTMEEFEKWKEDCERKSMSCFTQTSGLLAGRPGAGYHKYFACHHSGCPDVRHVNNMQNPIAKLPRRRSSKKMGANCTAFMKIFANNDHVKVTYCLAHFGHAVDPALLPLGRSVKKEITDLMIAGTTFRHIAKIIRGKSTPEERAFYLRHTDIRNLATKIVKEDPMRFILITNGGQSMIVDATVRDDDSIEDLPDSRDSCSPMPRGFDGVHYFGNKKSNVENSSIHTNSDQLSLMGKHGVEDLLENSPSIGKISSIHRDLPMQYTDDVTCDENELQYSHDIPCHAEENYPSGDFHSQLMNYPRYDEVSPTDFGKRSLMYEHPSNNVMEYSEENYAEDPVYGVHISEVPQQANLNLNHELQNSDITSTVNIVQHTFENSIRNLQDAHPFTPRSVDGIAEDSHYEVSSHDAHYGSERSDFDGISETMVVKEEPPDVNDCQFYEDVTRTDFDNSENLIESNDVVEETVDVDPRAIFETVSKRVPLLRIPQEVFDDTLHSLKMELDTVSSNYRRTRNPVEANRLLASMSELQSEVARHVPQLNTGARFYYYEHEVLAEYELQPQTVAQIEIFEQPDTVDWPTEFLLEECEEVQPMSLNEFSSH